MTIPYPWLSLLRGIFGLGACLVVLEVALHSRAIRSKLPLPSPYYNEEILLRRDLLRDYISENGEPEIVVIGSSVARSNLDAETLARVTGRRVFGLGFSAFPPSGLKLSWQKLWSKEFKTVPMLVVAFREYDLAVSYDGMSEALLSKGRIERGWFHPDAVSPFEKLGLTETRLATHYGSVSKALSIARAPLLGSPFVTGPLGTRAYSKGIDANRLKALQNSVVKIDGTKIGRHIGEFVQASRSFKETYPGRMILALSPGFEDIWESKASRVKTLELLDRRMRAAKLLCFVGTDDTFCSDIENYSDYTHFQAAGAMRFSVQLGEFLRSQWK